MQALKNIIERIERVSSMYREQLQFPEAIRSKNPILNRLLNGGFIKGNLYVVAGKQSIGKTTLIASLIADIFYSRSDTLRIGIITINCSEERFIARILSAISGVLLDKIFRGKMEKEDRKKISYFSSIEDFERIEISAPGYIDIDTLESTCIQWVSQKNVGIIFIDYLQLISVKETANQDLKIFTISKTLKKLSVDLNIPIVVLVPLNKNKEFSDIKDLRKEGAIEPFTDVIMILNNWKHESLELPYNYHEISLAIPKNNTGTTDRMLFLAMFPVQRFVEYDK